MACAILGKRNARRASFAGNNIVARLRVRGAKAKSAGGGRPAIEGQ